jgi:hypothetical protein
MFCIDHILQFLFEIVLQFLYNIHVAGAASDISEANSPLVLSVKLFYSKTENQVSLELNVPTTWQL